MFNHTKIIFLLVFLLVFGCSSNDPCKCTGAFRQGNQEVLVPNVDCATGAPGYQYPVGLDLVEADFLGCRETD